MRKLIALLGFSILLLSSSAFAQGVANSLDPCSTFPKLSAAINVSSATTVKLVSNTATAPIYVCGVYLNQVNGTGSWGLEYGTGTTCGTGTKVLNGPILASTVSSGVTNTSLGADELGTDMLVPAGNDLCGVSTGTIQQSGYVSYVQTNDITHISTVDPCVVQPKLSVAINTAASATTVQLVPAVANTSIDVCAITLNGVAVSGESLTFEYGTGTLCAGGAGATLLTGALSPSQIASSASVLNTGESSGGTQLAVPAGNALCELTGTSTGQQSGWVTYVQQNPSVNVSFFDPCIIYPKQSGQFAFSSATTTQIIPAVAGAQTYICGITLEDAGRATTANTSTIEYGTKVSTDCDTGATALAGPITGSLTAGTPTFVQHAGFGTQIVAPAGNQVCIATTQTTAVNGFVSYVQK